MSSCTCRILIVAFAAMSAGSALRAADQTVATSVYARVAEGYHRERGADGSCKPEFYALSNGGRVYGTTSDNTVDRVGYPQVAEIAARLLAQQNYHYAQQPEQAKLLLVLQWGNTIAFNGTNYSQLVSTMGAELSRATPQGMGSRDSGRVAGADGGGGSDTMIRLMMENRAREEVNERNARVLGYFDDLNDSNDIRRWAGGGDRYDELIADVEESRYYITISAYDFPKLKREGKKKLLWQVRVSVRSPGNSFDDSMVAMLKSASKYFGQDSSRLIRGEESKGTVEMGDLKFIGEAKEPAPVQK